VGLFFERKVTGDPIADAIEDALAVDPTVPSDRPAEARRRAATPKAATAGAPVQPKTGNIVAALIITAILLAVAFVLATWVDPLLISEAGKVVTTPGYKAPDLELKQLSEAVRTMLLAWSGGLVGAILGDGIGTSTAK